MDCVTKSCQCHTAMVLVCAAFGGLVITAALRFWSAKVMFMRCGLDGAMFESGCKLLCGGRWCEPDRHQSTVVRHAGPSACLYRAVPA